MKSLAKRFAEEIYQLKEDGYQIHNKVRIFTTDGFEFKYELDYTWDDVIKERVWFVIIVGDVYVVDEHGELADTLDDLSYLIENINSELYKFGI